MIRKLIIAVATLATALPGVAHAQAEPWHFVNGLMPDDVYRALTITRGTVHENGGGIQGWTLRQFATDQSWYWDDDTIRPADDRSTCLDANPDQNWDGGTVHLWKCNGSRQQKWAWSSSNYALVNDFSKRCLDANPRGPVDGGRIYQWSCNNSLQQRWYLWAAS